MTALDDSAPHSTRRIRDFCVAVAILVLVALLGWTELGLLAVLALCACVVVIASAPASLSLFTVAILSIPLFMSEFSVSLGGFKLYGVDFVIVLYVAAAVRAIALRGSSRRLVERPELEKLIVALVVVFTIYGAALTVYGLFVKGYPYDTALGDFRRYFFYPFAILLPIQGDMANRSDSKLTRAFAIGAVVIALVGGWRVISGSPVKLDINEATNYSGQRMLAVVEFCIAAMAAGYLIAKARVSRGLLLRLFCVGLAVVLMALLLRCGYRLAVVFAVFAPLFALGVITWLRRDNVIRIVGYGAAVIPVALVFLWGIGVVFYDQFERAAMDFEVRAMDAQVTGDYREWTWQQAMAELSTNPVIGTGLGHKLVFLNRTRAGHFEHKHASAHSTFVTLLYRTGIIGISLFMLLHGVFIVYVLRYARTIRPTCFAVVAGLLTGYVCITLASFTQPLHVAGYVAGPLVMGYILIMLRPEIESADTAS